jgi:hypothetical protein
MLPSAVSVLRHWPAMQLANINVPPGHTFVPWTVNELAEAIKVGKRVKDLLDKDWS